MTGYLIVFLFIFGLNASAQSRAGADLFPEGMRQANVGRYEEALKSYKSALVAAENGHAGNSHRARLHYNIGVCYFHLGQFEPAADHFTRSDPLRHLETDAAECERRIAGT